MLTKSFLRRAVTCAGLLILAATANAHSDDSKNVLYAANDGVDSATCGTRSNPCRSINQTIARASSGALIIVGPGRYGDLNRDRDLTEEQPDPACDCVFNIDKRLTIISREGAQQTILDMGSIGRHFNVFIAADGVVFGAEQRGFTVFAQSGPVLQDARVGIGIPFADHTTVAGNIVEIGERAAGLFIVFGTGHRIRGNRFAHNVNGIQVNSGGNRISGNSFYDNSLRGLSIDGQDNLIEFNSAVGNNTGMQLAGRGHLVYRNSFVSNRFAGISLQASSVTGTPESVRLLRNNFYGNGPAFGGGGENCGIAVNSPAGPIDARDNYWGSERGPGADPADQICQSVPSPTVLVQPFARKEFKIPVFW